MTKRRAISNDQKQQRREDIISASLALFELRDFESITMGEIAERAGLAKGTLYLYFPTKESLFLAIQSEQLSTWFDSVGEALRTHKPTLTGVQLTSLLTQALKRQPLLPRLQAILHTVLEKNVSDDEVLAFKYALLRKMQETGRTLEETFVALAPGQGMQVFLRLHGFVIGFWQMSIRVPALQNTSLSSELEVFSHDFYQILEETLSTYLAGLLELNREGRPPQ